MLCLPPRIERGGSGLSKNFPLTPTQAGLRRLASFEGRFPDRFGDKRGRGSNYPCQPQLSSLNLKGSRNRDSILPSEERTERNYDTDVLTAYIEENEPKMAQDQKEAFGKIKKAVFDRHGDIFVLDAPGGTGKTFLINLLLTKVRQRNEIALAVASSGITTTLLTGGRTAHSAFRLPLNLANTQTPTRF
ncbi:hypothetical protein AVEN_127849-1 [Araneus ventricosus]|uniref:ATP-dependent DNA helicase n=1 Tax=Araneus ventricosus TaxID=182803 RepID=A0A4Y1ZYK5_ARAVE|nr:hypothetical protein AVEN_127849-1 [Araneus ventricosus]